MSRFIQRFFQSIQLKLILIYILLILITVQLIGIYFVRELENNFVNNFSDTLNRQADLLAFNLARYLSEETNPGAANPEIDYLVNNLFAVKEGEVQVIDQNGIVLSTSVEGNRWIIGQKNTQTEVTRALLGTRDEVIKIDGQTGNRLKYLTVPIRDDNKILGAILMVASLEELYSTMSYINQIFISGTVIALLLTAALGILVSRTITNPVKEITLSASAMANGNFNRKVQVRSQDEIGRLGEAFNDLATRLKEAISANEEEKEKITSILTNMSDGVMATDGEGRVILVNRRARQMLGKAEHEVIGEEISRLLKIPKEKVDDLVLGDHPSILLDYTVDSYSGILRATFSPIKRRGKGIVGMIIVLYDVTEQEKLEQNRREFVANVSHELRTPLTTIKSYLEALEDGAWQDENLAPRFISVTHQETERMIRLVTDLLHLSRMDSKELASHKEMVDLVEVLEEVSDRFSFQAGQRHIDIELVIELPIPQVWMDRDQVDQVLDNLLSNAIKFTGEGGRIKIHSFVHGNQVKVSIEDNGVGIPEKDLDKVFDRFYRVDKARSRNMGGTGLGLSIAREIIRAHEGTIQVESEVGQGTKVSFAIPVSKEGRMIV